MAARRIRLSAAPAGIDGRTFLKDAATGKKGGRDHATVGWGSTPTVVTDRWWFNCKMNGTGVLLHDLKATEPFAHNVAAENTDAVNRLFALALQDARNVPAWGAM